MDVVLIWNLSVTLCILESESPHKLLQDHQERKTLGISNSIAMRTTAFPMVAEAQACHPSI